VDGTSPVDYLTEDTQRPAVRRLARQLLRERPMNWEEVLEAAEKEIMPLHDTGKP
jgi:hypothetical protein